MTGNKEGHREAGMGEESESTSMSINRTSGLALGDAGARSVLRIHENLAVLKTVGNTRDNVTRLFTKAPGILHQHVCLTRLPDTSARKKHSCKVGGHSLCFAFEEVPNGGRLLQDMVMSKRRRFLSEEVAPL